MRVVKSFVRTPDKLAANRRNASQVHWNQNLGGETPVRTEQTHPEPVPQPKADGASEANRSQAS